MDSHIWNLSSRLLSSGSLVIISPSVDDTARYECTVTSDAGEDERTVDLTVQGRASVEVGRMTHATAFVRLLDTHSLSTRVKRDKLALGMWRQWKVCGSLLFCFSPAHHS